MQKPDRARRMAPLLYALSCGLMVAAVAPAARAQPTLIT